MDTAYPAPDGATLAHYEERLDDLYRCGSDPNDPDRSMPCRQAENDSLIPNVSAP